MNAKNIINFIDENMNEFDKEFIESKIECGDKIISYFLEDESYTELKILTLFHDADKLSRHSNFKTCVADTIKYLLSNMAMSDNEDFDRFKESDCLNIDLVFIVIKKLNGNEIKELQKIADADITESLNNLKYQISVSVCDSGAVDLFAETEDGRFLNASFELSFKNPNSFDSKVNNIIAFTNEKSDCIIALVSGYDLASLYDKYKQRIFRGNVRYYINSEKSVDSAIKSTISENPSDFAYLNNGITIVARKFNVNSKDNKISIEDFTVVNGAQTITNIYMVKKRDKFKHDLYVSTKIIMPKKDDNIDQFLESITQSSNQQKPVLPRDLKSNNEEMISLRKYFSDNCIVLSIKRGDEKYGDQKLENEIAKKTNCKNVPHITNLLLGQIVLASLLKNPTKAIQYKTKIFSDKKIYKEIFLSEIFEKSNMLDAYNFYNDYRNLINTKMNEFTKKLENSGNGSKHSNTIRLLSKNLDWWIFCLLFTIRSSMDGIETFANSDINIGENQTQYVKNLYHFNEERNELSKNMELLLNIFFDEAEALYIKKSEEKSNQINKKNNVLSISAFSMQKDSFELVLEKVITENNLYENKKSEIFKGIFKKPKNR